MNTNYVQLTQSKNYKIIHRQENVYIAPLQSDCINEYIEIGDFYENPEIAIVDENEKWSAIGGCGVIIYFIQEPFTPYKYDQESSQYFEIHRNPPSIWWSSSLQQITPSKILTTLENTEIWVLDVCTRKISK